VLVYKITNTVNDRIYIGLTTCDLKKRWKEHKSAAKTGSEKPLYRAMQKYGVDKFHIEVAYVASSIEEMRQVELKLIDELGAHTAVNGYNLTDHGYRIGNFNQKSGESVYNAKLTEEIVGFIRNPEHLGISNENMLAMVQERFLFDGKFDSIRDARRGDTWRHLNDLHAPVKCGQGNRRSELSDEQKSLAKETLATHHSAAIAKSAEMRRGKKGSHGRLSEEVIRGIFFSPESLMKTAVNFGISKKMVLLIKQRKAHTYLTQGL
jgi:group I intron endonuclease